jgi:hypothetical protein
LTAVISESAHIAINATILIADLRIIIEDINRRNAKEALRPSGVPAAWSLTVAELA